MRCFAPRFPLAIGLLLGATGWLAAQDPFDPDGAAQPGAKPAAAPAVPPAQKGKKDGEPADLEGALPEGPERNPVVLAIRDSKPSKPDELMFAVQTLVDIGRADEAKIYLKKLLAAKPPGDVLVAFSQKYGTPFFYRLHSDHRMKPEGEQLARAVLDAAYAASRDPARLKALVKQLNEPAPLARDKALDQLRGSGIAAVAPILQALADPQRAAEHPRLRAALVGLGPTVIDPLLAAVDCADAGLRVEVIEVLGRFRTSKAVPLLLGPYLAPDTAPEVRTAIQKTLQQIVGQSPSRYEAEQYLFRRAQGFFQGDLPAAVDYDDKVVMWRWDEKQKDFVSKRYLAAEAGLILAARLARDLYRLAPENVEFRRLFLTTNLQSAQLENGLGRPLPKDEGTMYAQAAALGVDVLEDLLAHALEKDYVPAAIAAAQILGDRGDAGLLRSEGGRPRTLTRALQHRDRRLRMTAARAIMQINPPQAYAGSSYLPEALAYVARTVGSRRVLVAHPRLERAQSLVGLLNRIGFQADAARTGNETFQMASVQPDYEFALLSDALDKPAVGETIQMLRRDPRTSGLPIGLMAREENLGKSEEYAALDPLVLAFPRPHDVPTITYEATRLSELGGRNATTFDERMDQAEEALDDLALLAKSSKEYAFYDLHRHEAAIQSALSVPQLSVKAAAVLGLLGSPSAQRALVDCASQPARPLAERQAAAQGFAVAGRRHGVLLTRAEIAQQYERYNQSEAFDRETQQVLASLLDTIETQSKKR